MEIELDNGRSEFECVQQLGVVQVGVERIESNLEGRMEKGLKHGTSIMWGGASVDWLGLLINEDYHGI